MKARDAMSLTNKVSEESVERLSVSGGMHLLEVLPKLFETPSRELSVVENDREIGVIDAQSMLDALGRLIASRYDCSIIEVECSPVDYSASALARAVEDTDAHLVDMFSLPSDEGHLKVTLRIRCEDPTAAVHSLERYGYTVTEVFGHENMEATASLERLLALQALINI